MVSNWLFKLFVGQFLEPAEKMAAVRSFFFLSLGWGGFFGFVCFCFSSWPEEASKDRLVDWLIVFFLIAIVSNWLFKFLVGSSFFVFFCFFLGFSSRSEEASKDRSHPERPT